MKRYIAFLLAVLMLLSLAACGEKAAAAPATTEAPATPAPTEPNGITLINARTAEGESFLLPEAGKTVVAKVYLPDDHTMVDHWEFNGETLDANGRVYSVELPLDEAGTLTPVFRPLKEVTGINCYLQLLDANGNGAGQTYSRLAFEKAYINPVTGDTLAGGTINVCVTADIPAGKDVDYWLINGVAYFYNYNVTTFTVGGLDETTVYEVVFKDSGKGHTLPPTTPYDPGGHGFPDDEPTNPDPNKDDPVNPGLIPPEEIEGDPIDPVNPPDKTEDPTPPTTTDPTGHTHAWQLTDTTSAWCTYPGYNYYECAYCHQVVENVGEPALGHNMAPVYDPTGICTGYACSRCGAKAAG